MKRLTLWLMQSSIYAFLLRNVIPYIRFTTYYTKFTGKQYFEAYCELKPGDIILTADKKKLTGLLIPGPVDHAAFCVNSFIGMTAFNNPEQYEVAEMTHENYKKSMFFDICKESDRVIIMRTPFDQDYIKTMIRECRTFDQAVYDIDFDLGIKSLYCSELIYHSDIEKRLDLDLSDLHGLGRKYISPTGILTNKNLFCVYDSDGMFTGFDGASIEGMINDKTK